MLLGSDTEFVVESVMPDLLQECNVILRTSDTVGEATVGMMRITFSMSSQFVTIPCSMGYLSVKIPRLDCASSPT